MTKIRVFFSAVTAIAGAVFVMAHTGVAHNWVSFQDGVTIGPDRVHDAMLAPVRGYFSELVQATYGPQRQELTHYRTAVDHYLSAHARNQLQKSDTPKASAGDRLEWTNAVDLDPFGASEHPTVKLSVKSTSADDLFSFNFLLSEANVGVTSDDARIITRGAVSGCKVLDGDFTVIPRASRWIIDRLPVERSCRAVSDENPDALQQSWSYVPPPRGRTFGDYGGEHDDSIPGWARGNLQHVDARAAGPADPGYPAGLAVDPEDRSDNRATGWRSPPGRGAGSRLTFRFPHPVRLAIVKVHNGAGLGRSVRRNGRVAIATLEINGRQFGMLLPDRPERYELHCDFGATDHLVLTVRSVYPEGTKLPTIKSGPDTFVAKALAPHHASNAALSEVSFFGIPAPADSSTAASRQPPQAAQRPKLLANTYSAICPADDPEPAVTYNWPLDDRTSFPIAFAPETWLALGVVPPLEPSAADGTTAAANLPANEVLSSPAAGP